MDGSDVLSALGPKYFQALLKGVIKMRIYADPEITGRVIRDQIFSDQKWAGKSADVGVAVSSLERFVATAARENWSASALSEALAKAELGADNTAVFLKVWKGERSKIHEALVQQSVWNKTLDNVSWRVDLKSASKAEGQVESNEATAIIELNTKDASGAECVQFELTKAQLDGLVAQFDDIAGLIRKKASQPKKG